MERSHFYFLRNLQTALLILLSVLFSPKSFAQPDIQLKSEIGANLTSPMHLANAGDGTGRIFVSERGGVVKVFNSNFTYLGVYLDITTLVSTGGEGGLLSIAFHPNFETNGCLFVHYVDKFGNVAVDRYDASNPASNAMDDTTPISVLTIPHPQTNHYGGEMHFGPDGHLYISVGDGGGSNDTNNNAQDPTKLLGKILRIQPATSGANTYTVPSDNPFPGNQSLPRNEVYCIGLRNPFRWSFDSATGDMWIGDVGQGAKEEIDHCPAAMIKGANFGWRCYEGDIRTPAYNSPTYETECAAYGNFVPRYTYDHSLGQSVIGGVTYHGSRYPDMDGYYIGSDYYSGIFHILAPESGSGRMGAIMLDNKINISDFGEGENGEIYAVSMADNSVFRFVDANVDPLPVSLVSFTAKRSIEGIRLSWKTSTEERFHAFDIEYSSTGKSFSKIGTVNGTNSQSGSEYHFTHSSAPLSLAYYRLKMVDIDGTYDYSTILPVNIDKQAGDLVLPSLITSGTLIINIEKPYDYFELIGVSGTTLLKSNITSKTGKLDIPVNLVPSALYIVRLSGGDLPVYTQKVVIAP